MEKEELQNIKGEFATFLIQTKLGEKFTEFDDFDQIATWWLQTLDREVHKKFLKIKD
jgi:hypothetical protein